METTKASLPSSRPRTGGRSARVVRDVLNAVVEVFAEHGYAGVSFEEVAARAGVNKTTVYRRWPTKVELVAAALMSLRENDPETPDSGSLREDLFVILRHYVERMSTPQGRSIGRAFIVGGAEPELASVVATLRRERPLFDRRIFERASERGELPRGTDVDLVTEALLGPIQARLHWKRQPIDDAYLTRLIDLVVTGAAAGGAVQRKRAR